MFDPTVHPGKNVVTVCIPLTNLSMYIYIMYKYIIERGKVPRYFHRDAQPPP